ncbi:MAG: hypothetical protein IPO49_01540 [Bacteroidetes bacterium]|jgi:hypothetical protein|nr:hypothetical protein [Bacteroidota bacterium]
MKLIIIFAFLIPTLPFKNISSKLPENEMEQVIQKLIVNRSADIEKIEELFNIKMQIDSASSTPFFSVYKWNSEKSELPFHSMELRLPIPESKAADECLAIFKLPIQNRYTKEYVNEHFGDSIQVVPPRPGQLDEQITYYRISGKDYTLSFGFSNNQNSSSTIVLNYAIESRILH